MSGDPQRPDEGVADQTPEPARAYETTVHVEKERREPPSVEYHFEWSDDIAELATALAAAQGDFKEFERDRRADITAKKEGGRSYSYSYEDLAEVIAATRPHLSKHGLAVSQFPSAGRTGVKVTTVVFHKSGQWLRSTLALACDTSEPRAVGSGISYARRYAYKCIMNVAPGEGEDDDGEAAGRPASRRDEGQPRPAQRSSSQATAKPVGKVAKLTKNVGATMVMLDSGFAASTRDASIVAGLASAKERGVVVELDCQASSDPARFVPTIIAMSEAK